MSAFDGSNERFGNRFKLFNEAKTREVVLGRLRQQLLETGACAGDIDITLCLACGRIATAKHRRELHAYFKSQDWELWDEDWIYERLHRLSQGSYENHVSSVVAKLLLRRKEGLGL